MLQYDVVFPSKFPLVFELTSPERSWRSETRSRGSPQGPHHRSLLNPFSLLTSSRLSKIESAQHRPLNPHSLALLVTTNAVDLALTGIRTPRLLAPAWILPLSTPDPAMQWVIYLLSVPGRWVDNQLLILCLVQKLGSRFQVSRYRVSAAPCAYLVYASMLISVTPSSQSIYLLGKSSARSLLRLTPLCFNECLSYRRSDRYSV